MKKIIQFSFLFLISFMFLFTSCKKESDKVKEQESNCDNEGCYVTKMYSRAIEGNERFLIASFEYTIVNDKKLLKQFIPIYGNTILFFYDSIGKKIKEEEYDTTQGLVVTNTYSYPGGNGDKAYEITHTLPINYRTRTSYTYNSKGGVKRVTYHNGETYEFSDFDDFGNPRLATYGTNIGSFYGETTMEYYDCDAKSSKHIKGMTFNYWSNNSFLITQNLNVNCGCPLKKVVKKDIVRPSTTPVNTTRTTELNSDGLPYRIRVDYEDENRGSSYYIEIEYECD